MITDTGHDTPLPLYALDPGPLLLQYDLSPMVCPLVAFHRVVMLDAAFDSGGEGQVQPGHAVPVPPDHHARQRAQVVVVRSPVEPDPPVVSVDVDLHSPPVPFPRGRLLSM